MATFKSLPLEIRSMIYDHALSNDHSTSNHGILPALYKVCPTITTELYSYHKTTLTVPITYDTPYRSRPAKGTKPSPLQTNSPSW
jgi:hypothetical protein